MVKILIIEDDPQLRRALVRILTNAGHDLVEAADGRDGLSRFRAKKPTLVITDILMPVKEGLETIGELRKESPGVAIIAMSGGEPAFLDIAKMLGANATIIKPFLTSDLMRAINTLLDP